MSRFLLLFLLTSVFSCERDACNGIGRDGVCIRVVNNSGQRVEHLLLTSIPHHRRQINQVIANGSETSISYHGAGESSFRLEVVLENGDTIRSQESYAEGGYALTQTIGKNRIKTEYDTGGY